MLDPVPPLDLPDVDPLIPLIYGQVLDTCQYRALAERLGEHFHCTSILVAALHGPRSRPVVVRGSLGEKQLEDIFDWLPSAVMQQGRGHGEPVFEVKYQCSVSQQSREMVGVAWGNDPRHLLVLLPDRAGSCPEIGQLLTAVVPHLLRVEHLIQKAHTLAGDHEHDSARSYLKSAHHAVFLIDRDGTLHDLNQPAQRLVNEDIGFRIDHMRLRAQGDRLKELLVSCSRDDHGSSCSLFWSDQPERSLAVLVHQVELPLLGYIVEVIDSRSTPTYAPEHLMSQLFGFTKTESLVVAALIEGRSSKDIAEVLGMSVNTARVHVQRVLDKTGCRRQAEVSCWLRRIILVHQSARHARDSGFFHHRAPLLAASGDH